MKRKKFTRQIRTQKGAREGVQSLTTSYPESDQEWQEAAAHADDVHLHLRHIIEAAEKLLERIPEPRDGATLLPTASTPIYGHSGLEAAPDGSLVNSTDPEIVKMSETIVGYMNHRSVIEPASPEYFAWMARDAANAALQALDDGDMIQSVSNAMDAVSNWHRMEFGEFWEPAVAREREAAKGRSKGGGRRKRWAEELAQWLFDKYPEKAVSAAMIQQRLPVGKARPDDPEYAGYQVWRHTDEVGDKAELMAYNELIQDADSLRWGAFRLKYLGPLLARR